MRYEFNDWQLSENGRWEKWLVNSAPRSLGGIFDGIHLMEGSGHSYHPHFWGKLVSLGNICKSVFNFHAFWDITDPEQAKRRTDTMIDFIERNNILVPDKREEPRIAGNVYVNGERFKLTRETNEQR